MPDWCMCQGGQCPLKEKCWRHIVEPNPYWQSYFSEPPFRGDECSEFIEANPLSQENRLTVTTRAERKS